MYNPIYNNKKMELVFLEVILNSIDRRIKFEDREELQRLCSYFSIVQRAVDSLKISLSIGGV